LAAVFVRRANGRFCSAAALQLPALGHFQAKSYSSMTFASRPSPPSSLPWCRFQGLCSSPLALALTIAVAMAYRSGCDEFMNMMRFWAFGGKPRSAVISVSLKKHYLLEKAGFYGLWFVVARVYWSAKQDKREQMLLKGEFWRVFCFF